MTARQSKNQRGWGSANSWLELCHGQENNRVYWLLADFQIWCLVQGFTTKASFVRLLYKLILAHSHSSKQNLASNFTESLNVSHSHSKHFEVSDSQSKKSKCLELAKKIGSLVVSQSLAFTIRHPFCLKCTWHKMKQGIINICHNMSISYLSLFWSCKINGYYIK